MRVTVLGLGKMGSAISRRLGRSGFELTVWNRTRSKADALGVSTAAATPAEAARGADIVLSSLTDAPAVRDVYLGPDGARDGASGQLFIEMSTAGPDILPELASALRARGSGLVDAPVVGTVTAVEAGKLLVLAGGPEADVERAMPVLQTLGEVQRVGDLGSGAALKLVANSMLGMVTVAGAELLAAAERTGLDPDVAFSTLARYAPGLAGRRDGYLHGHHSPAMFALRDLLKDLDLGLGLFHRSGATTPLTALVRELVADSARTAAALDISAITSRYATESRAAEVGSR
jgi:3-hydroxyisobutyrate dehydrogenase/2-hydroxy-3-oxopropionate reductase